MDGVIQKLERIASILRAAQTKGLEDFIYDDIRLALLNVLEDIDEEVDIINCVLEDLFSEEQIEEELEMYYDIFPGTDIDNNKTVLQIILHKLIWDNPNNPRRRRKKKRKRKRKRKAMKVQSYAFDKKRWTPSRARGWLKKKGISHKRPDIAKRGEKQKYHRFRVKEPLKRGVIRWHPLGEGIYAVIQRPK